MRNAGSSRKAVNTSFSRRLAARSMAFALGRSMVTSRTTPLMAVRMPADDSARMSNSLHEADQRVDRDGAAPPGADDHGVQVELGETLDVGRRVARTGERRVRT